MDKDATCRRADEQTRARHEQAVAAGEKRLLNRTMDGGRLHSYAADEIGFARAGSVSIVTTAPGMLLLAILFRRGHGVLDCPVRRSTGHWPVPAVGSIRADPRRDRRAGPRRAAGVLRIPGAQDPP